MRYQEALNQLDRIEKGLATHQAIIVAGGCFWGVEYFFEQEPGVIATAVGYTGGSLKQPTYQQVCAGHSGHYEATLVIFDPHQTDVITLYRLFFNIHDARQRDGQGPDIGPQYRSAIFTLHDQQRHQAQALMNELAQNDSPLATQVLPFEQFWPAEDYHQHYYANRHEQPTCHFRRG